MAIRTVLTVPNPILRKKSKAVDSVDDDIRRLFDDMLETMYHYNGIGLAAPQIGVLKRVLVMDVRGDHTEKESNIYYMANPLIVKHSEEENTYTEGCLSVPEQFEEVTRPRFATVKYLNYHGEEIIEECDELLATCVQHEIDHLDGIVFIDHLTKLKKDMMLRKAKKINKTLE